MESKLEVIAVVERSKPAASGESRTETAAAAGDVTAVGDVAEAAAVVASELPEARRPC